MSEPHEKLARLCRLLGELDGAAVAFSGGVDSSLLLATAAQVLGNRVLALTAASPAVPETERQTAARVAQQLGVRHVLVPTREVTLAGYADNPPDRCFHCKQEMYGRFREVMVTEGLTCLLDGATTDDRGDFRPGMRAARQLEVRHPLMEVGLNKDEVRQLAREMELPVWDKPAYSCLSSRFPYGERITPEKLARVEQAEAAVKALLGAADLRVRSHGALARLELPINVLEEAVRQREALVHKLRSLGYIYVTLDLMGLRSGSLNEMLRADRGGD